jgi:hypothetical protein
MGTYDFQLTVTDNKGAQATSTVSIYVLPNKDTRGKITFKIYPNPAHGELHVDLDKPVTGKIQFRVIDVSGKVLGVFQYGQLPAHFTKVLDISNVAPGIYFIQLIEDNQLRDVKKLIIY